LNAAIPVLSPDPSRAPLEPDSKSLVPFICNERRSVGIERKNFGQCDYRDGMFEYIQIKTILNPGLKPF
jgi:hypothetical protein